jgi:hypothetical protein
MALSNETLERLQSLSKAQRAQRFNELSKHIVNPRQLDDSHSDDVPTSTLEEAEEREWLKNDLGLATTD